MYSISKINIKGAFSKSSISNLRLRIEGIQNLKKRCTWNGNRGIEISKIQISFSRSALLTQFRSRRPFRSKRRSAMGRSTDATCAVVSREGRRGQLGQTLTAQLVFYSTKFLTRRARFCRSERRRQACSSAHLLLSAPFQDNEQNTDRFCHTLFFNMRFLFSLRYEKEADLAL